LSKILEGQIVKVIHGSILKDFFEAIFVGPIKRCDKPCPKARVNTKAQKSK
jgi:hypothetical protein